MEKLNVLTCQTLPRHKACESQLLSMERVDHGAYPDQKNALETTMIFATRFYSRVLERAYQVWNTILIDELCFRTWTLERREVLSVRF